MIAVCVRRPLYLSTPGTEAGAPLFLTVATEYKTRGGS
jgi:hypothetical protein